MLWICWISVSSFAFPTMSLKTEERNAKSTSFNVSYFPSGERSD